MSKKKKHKKYLKKLKKLKQEKILAAQQELKVQPTAGAPPAVPKPAPKEPSPTKKEETVPSPSPSPQDAVENEVKRIFLLMGILVAGVLILYFVSQQSDLMGKLGEIFARLVHLL